MTKLSISSKIASLPPAVPVARELSTFRIVRFRRFCQYVSLMYAASLFSGTNPLLFAVVVIFSHASFFCFFETFEENAPKSNARCSRMSSKTCTLELSTLSG